MFVNLDCMNDVCVELKVSLKRSLKKNDGQFK